MIYLMKHVILIFMAFGLSACASNGLQLSASQCAADWRSVGVADGVEGAPETKINEYRSACARTSPLASSDIAAWKQGWAEGADVAYNAEPLPEDETYEVAEAHDHSHSHGGRSHRSGPVISPSVSIGVGSGGVRGGVGLGVGFGLFRLGLGLGF